MSCSEPDECIQEVCYEGCNYEVLNPPVNDEVAVCVDGTLVYHGTNEPCDGVDGCPIDEFWCDVCETEPDPLFDGSCAMPSTCSTTAGGCDPVELENGRIPEESAVRMWCRGRGICIQKFCFEGECMEDPLEEARDNRWADCWNGVLYYYDSWPCEDDEEYPEGCSLDEFQCVNYCGSHPE